MLATTRGIRKVLLFVALTFFFSWLLLDTFLLLGGQWNSRAAIAVAVGYMFVPMIVAFAVQKLISKEPLRKPFGISFRPNRWWLVAWLLPPAIAFAAFGVSLLFPGVGYSSDLSGFFERMESMLSAEKVELMKDQMKDMPIGPLWLGLLQGLVAGPTINAVAAFGEETGWRGLLQKELGHVGFWKSSLTIGAIWGVWHAPLILQGHNYPEHPMVGVFMMTAWCMLLSPMFSYVRLRAKSVIAAAIMHGSLNATCGLAILALTHLLHRLRRGSCQARGYRLARGLWHYTPGRTAGGTRTPQAESTFPATPCSSERSQ